MAKKIVLELARMSRTELDSAAKLHGITVPAGASDDDLRELLMKHGGFSWSWSLANFVAGVLVLIAAGFIGSNWATVFSLIGVGFLIWDVVRTHKRLKLVTGYTWKKTARESFGELFGILAIGLGLGFNTPLLLAVAGLILIADGIKEKWL